MRFVRATHANERREAVLGMERCRDFRGVDERVVDARTPGPPAHLFLARQERIDLVIDERCYLQGVNFEQGNRHGRALSAPK